MQEREAGRLDLDAPVTRYLPWFAVRTGHGPITLHHLLSHTGGIIRGTDFSPDARFEVWAARETETGSPPGERFHYSNLGYKALGILLAAIAGRSYGEIVEERILRPLGMAASVAAITHETRRRLATGYAAFYDDRPRRRADPLAPATWLETDTGDGCLATTAADLAAYLRMLLNHGRGPTGCVLSHESFALMTRPVIDAWPGTSYGYGLATMEIDGHRCVGHGGGMVGYNSDILGDLDDGLGVVVLANGPGVVPGTAPFILRCLRAARHGEPPPDGSATDPLRVDNAAEYAGTYRGGAGEIDLTAERDRLLLRLRGDQIELEPRGEDAFLVDHPDFARFLLRFGRAGDRVVEAFHGGGWYANERYAGPTRFDYPEGWTAYAGHYRSHNPWRTNFRVVLRKGALVLVEPSGDEESLVPLGEDTFRIGDDPASPERLRFDAVVNGEALRANRPGCDYYRFFTP